MTNNEAVTLLKSSRADQKIFALCAALVLLRAENEEIAETVEQKLHTHWKSIGNEDVRTSDILDYWVEDISAYVKHTV